MPWNHPVAQRLPQAWVRRARTRLMCFLLTSLPLGAQLSVARAHGGLPVAQQILWHGSTMYIPTPYWGLFLGPVGGPFHWICDEAINSYVQHRFAVAKDGALYVTDRTGVQVSTDGGCQFDPTIGPLASHFVAAIAAEPLGTSVLALASEDTNQTSLWRAADGKSPFALLYAVPQSLPTGLRLSEDGRVILVVAMTTGIVRTPRLHVSADGGRSFVDRDFPALIDGQVPIVVAPLWIDPTARPAGQLNDLYLAGRSDSIGVVWRLRDGEAPVELFRTTAGILDMQRHPQSRQLVVSTVAGLWAEGAGGGFSRQETLSASQCLSVHEGSLYACGWNFPPDSAAVARLPVDVSQKESLFQYQQTVGPLACPATTQVGKVCPGAWSIYAPQLGIELKKPDPPATVQGCQVGSFADPSRALSKAPVGWLALVALARLIRARRQRGR